MLAQKLTQQSLRRLALQPSTLRFATPAAVALGNNSFQQQRRQVTAAAVSESHAGNEILAKQRLNRPVAPHLAIYKPQITWYLSALNRVTGVAASGAFYAFGLLYLAAPSLGWHLESAALAASFGAWPVLLQVLTKTILALPVTFHSLNGVRHLVWDTASMITNKQVQTTGWTVVGLSVASALGLAFL
uniref:Mitochondrial succinate dehydrogenase subunit C n=1 Tax=Zymoseptoria tritici TaxID=1047171 RepID=G4XX57_ZYMTR|nr:mitochondrial succinate dehydrogenase subunit C [Zymoseptoria tritici]